MRTHHYPSDVTDEQWALIEPHLPPEPGGGRPRKTDVRDVLDAILYILRTGCQWRYLPVDFPPKSTVWRYFDRWRRDGTLDTIHDLLRRINGFTIIRQYGDWNLEPLTAASPSIIVVCRKHTY